MTSHSKLQFLVTEEGQPDRLVRLRDGAVFGRGDDVDCTVGKDGGWTSKMHARVIYRDDRWWLEDLGSRNKTRVVDGPTLTAGERHEIEPDVEFLLGKVSLKVVEVIGPASREPSAGVDTDFIDLGDDDASDEESPSSAIEEGETMPSPAPAREAEPEPEPVESKPEPEPERRSEPVVESPAAEVPAADPPPEDAFPDDEVGQATVLDFAPPPSSESVGRKTAVDEDLALFSAKAPPPPSLEAPTAPELLPKTPPPEPPPAPEAPSPAPTPVPESAAAPSSAPVPAPAPLPESENQGATMMVSGLSRDSSQHQHEGLERARPRLILADDAIRRVVPIDHADFLIGREPQEAVHIHCTILHDAVSGLHARISFDGDDFFLEDLNSRNGTFLDQVRLEPRQKRRLRPETRIRFGVIEALFVVDHDPRGGSVEEGTYRQAARLLRQRGRITPQQESRALERVGGDHRRLAEALLMERIVDLEAWCQAFEDASKLGLVADPDEKLYRKLALVLGGLIGITAIVVIILIIQLLTRGD